jgi:hypothetical protein
VFLLVQAYLMALTVSGVADIQKVYRKELVSSDDILKPFKDNKISLEEYEAQYINLISHCNLANVLSPEEVDQVCFFMRV